MSLEEIPVRSIPHLQKKHLAKKQTARVKTGLLLTNRVEEVVRDLYPDAISASEITLHTKGKRNPQSDLDNLVFVKNKMGEDGMVMVCECKNLHRPWKITDGWWEGQVDDRFERFEALSKWYGEGIDKRHYAKVVVIAGVDVNDKLIGLAKDKAEYLIAVPPMWGDKHDKDIQLFIEKSVARIRKEGRTMLKKNVFVYPNDPRAGDVEKRWNTEHLKKSVIEKKKENE